MLHRHVFALLSQRWSKTSFYETFEWFCEFSRVFDTAVAAIHGPGHRDGERLPTQDRRPGKMRGEGFQRFGLVPERPYRCSGVQENVHLVLDLMILSAKPHQMTLSLRNEELRLRNMLLYKGSMG